MHGIRGGRDEKTSSQQRITTACIYIDAFQVSEKGKENDLQSSELSLARFKEKNTDSLPRLYGSNSTRFAQLNDLIEQRKVEQSGAIAAKKTIRTRLAQVDPVMSEILTNTSNIWRIQKIICLLLLAGFSRYG